MSLPENTGYTPYMDRMSDVAMSVGKSLGPRKRSPKAVDTSQFSGVTGAIQAGANRPKQIPMSAKNVGKITTKYGGATKFEKNHRAIDYTQGMGSPVGSWVGGKVSEVVTGKKQGDPGFGNFVIVTDSQGNRHRYSHLQQGYVPVSVGQQIQRGTVLGLEGNTGQTYSLHGGSGAHTDLRIRDLWNNYINPMQFIN